MVRGVSVSVPGGASMPTGGSARQAHSWRVSVSDTQHAALSSLLWAELSWLAVASVRLPAPPLVTLLLRLVSFFSSLANDIPFLLSSRTI